MAFRNLGDVAVSEERARPVVQGRRIRFVATASAVALAGVLAPSAGIAADCQWGPVTQLHIDSGLEPQLLIDGTCEDPDYNARSFVITKTEQLTFQVPDGGPLIPYTQVTGHFPVLVPEDKLPPGIRQSPKTHQQEYVWRFPAKEFWRNRSFQVQHPTGGGSVDNRLAFTNGAFSVNWRPGNPTATHRHHAAATRLAKAYADQLYGNTAKIYSYYWGLSGGGVVATAAAENTTGVWDAVQIQMSGIAAATHHTRAWEGLYQMAVPAAKRAAVAAAVAVGSGRDIYAGLNAEEKAVLDELLSGGSPREKLRANYSLTPLVHPVEFRLVDPTYEDDFWSKPGYAGTNPPNYLKAALVDGMATITGITRDPAGVPTAIQFDPATVPKLGTMGAAELRYYVMGADGTTHVIDPALPPGTDLNTTARPLINRRYSLIGDLDTATGTLTLTPAAPPPRVNNTAGAPTGTPPNNAFLLNALKVGGKVRINNRFILAAYHYPRHTNQPGLLNYDQYRNADGSPKYPQRANIIGGTNLRTMGGRTETGHIKTRTMHMANLGDDASWPLLNTSYADMVHKALGPAKSDEMFRMYVNEKGGHHVRAEIAGIFTQSLIDMIAWAERGIAPKPSSRYEHVLGQVVLAEKAADRHGLQPVMSLTANGGDRAVVGVNQPVNLVGTLEMPPNTGQIVQYNWSTAGTADPAIVPAPQPRVDVSRTMTFPTPGDHLVRLSVNGQRDGLVAPFDQTLVQNYREVRVVVTGPAGGGGERGK